jgi:hypothetical protein
MSEPSLADLPTPEPEPRSKPPDGRRLAVAIVAFAIGVILSAVLNWGYTTYAINQAKHQNAHAIQVGQQETAHAIRLGQEEGARAEAKICVTFTKLHQNKPPAGNPLKNPSRRYDQNQYAILGELPGDLGC